MFATGKLVNQLLPKLLQFDKANDLHFRIQSRFGQISSTQ